MSVTRVLKVHRNALTFLFIFFFGGGGLYRTGSRCFSIFGFSIKNYQLGSKKFSKRANTGIKKSGICAYSKNKIKTFLSNTFQPKKVLAQKLFSWFSGHNFSFGAIRIFEKIPF
jgi:hypothetical protein